MSRYFEKISFDQFRSDVSDDKAMYENYSLPKRGTINSAGYDFEALYDFVIKPGQIKKIRSEEHTSELQSRFDLVCRLLLEKKK